MAWNEALTQLRDLFAELYDTENTIRSILDEAEIPSGEVDFDGGVIQIWHSALTVAQRRKRIDALCAVARAQYPEHAATIDTNLTSYQKLANATSTFSYLPAIGKRFETIPKAFLFGIGALILVLLLVFAISKLLPPKITITTETGDLATQPVPTTAVAGTSVATEGTALFSTQTPSPQSVDEILRQDALTAEQFETVQRYLRGSAPMATKIEKVVALGRPEWEGAIPLLLEFVHNNSADTQAKSNAIGAIGRIGGVAAQTALMQLFRQSPHDPTIRQNCLDALYNMNVTGLPAAEVLVLMQTVVREDSDDSVQVLAIKILGWWRAESAVTDIIWALGHLSVDARVQAAQTLAFFPESLKAREVLLKKAQDHEEVDPPRIAAINTLSTLKDVAAKDLMDQIRQDPLASSELQQAAQEGYIRLRDLPVAANSGATATPTPNPTPTSAPILQKGMQGKPKTAILLYVEPDEALEPEWLDDDATVTLVRTDPSELSTLWAFVEVTDLPTNDRQGWVRSDDFDWFIPTDKPIVRGKLWPNGTVLTVGFLEGAPELRDWVRQYAVEWTEYANLKFEFVEDVLDADIRISFDRTMGSWSYIGTDNLVVPKTSATMNLGTIVANADEEYARGTILHEFGHVLGLYHEQLNPNHTIPWDREAVYAFFEKQGWSQAQVDLNFFSTWNSTTFPLEKPFDRDSVMLYAFPDELTVGDYSLPVHNTLSAGDKGFVMRLYPKPQDESNGAAETADPLATFTQPVGRLSVLAQDGTRWLCTAAVLSERYIVTVDFCWRNARSMTLRMGFTAPDAEITEYTVLPDPVEYNETLHYAIFEVEGNPAEHFGTVPIFTRLAREGESMFGAMYVNGNPLALTQNRCLARKLLPPNFDHNCPTGGGSAGALLIAAEDFAVVGLHHSANGPTDENTEPERVGSATLFAEIALASPIVRQLLQDTPPK